MWLCEKVHSDCRAWGGKERQQASSWRCAWVLTSQSANFTMKTPQSQPFLCSGMSLGAICFHSDTSSVASSLCLASSVM